MKQKGTVFQPLLINNIFYSLKPYIPRPLQIALRRRIAQYKRKKYARIWPIDHESAAPPKGWNGWPDGKQFALVLSHDVDNHKGQDRVLDLARIEMKLGFRSAFHFVPERYDNHEHIKKFLRGNGFEIGVHGLKHDGKLFSHKKIFLQRATKINQYLESWQTRGFTSPSMHRNSSWMHQLNITYSISSFDTDPFEPQPKPVRTIFPFWIFNDERRCGFVELPYTMPQDHLLFIILQERNIDIWKRKLDWVADKGGMVLLTTHSDYMNFNGSNPGNEEYDIGHYVKLLYYVKTAFAGQYWHARPSEIAAYFRQYYVD